MCRPLFPMTAASSTSQSSSCGDRRAGSAVPGAAPGPVPGTHAGVLRVHDVIEGPGDGAGELAEDEGLLGDLHGLLLAVVVVVEPHADHLLGVPQGRQQLRGRPGHAVLPRLQRSAGTGTPRTSAVLRFGTRVSRGHALGGPSRRVSCVLGTLLLGVSTAEGSPSLGSHVMGGHP